MNRQENFNFIEDKLSQLAFRIEVRGGLNILDLHLHSESFYLHLLNLLFGWELQNLNAEQKNSAGIDLLDTTNKIIAQVSATATKQKIESALSKDLSKYSDYAFKFVSISKNVSKLRTKVFSNPHNLNFIPNTDILDISSLLRCISDMEIYQQRKVYEFLKKELKNEPDTEKVESNLTAIIKNLSKEDWSQGTMGFETVPYDPEIKISYNQLVDAKFLIDDYKIHYNRINNIYSDFDKQGVNKSISILNGIRTEYLALGAIDSPDQCFFSIIEKVTQKVRASANYTPIPDEELVLCVQILVVDAFIRCKIFKNPSGVVSAGS
ncbi:MAG: SMEK domain-containing protein [Desulfobulbaceae bacterium]|nr:SMEK domain-containing protein [Desulfobulbaceae bacterium]